MPKIDITRTELVWPGKYDADGNLVPPRRVSLPFQVIERVSETRATRQQREAEKKGHAATLFDYWQEGKVQTNDLGDGWRNKLIWGDNLYILGSLAEKFAGKLDLIYIDPPFATGTDFSFKAEIGDGFDELEKQQSIIEEKAYRDTWGSGLSSYLSMMQSRLLLMRDLLSDSGCIYVHCDWRVNSFLRMILDDIFGKENFVNEIIWHYRTFQGQTHRYFAKKHDTLLLYAKSNNFVFNEQYATEFDDTIDSQRWANYINENHQIVGSRMPIQDSRFTRYLRKWIKKNGREPGPDDIVFEVLGQPVDSVWDMKGLDPTSLERLNYATQKPELLLERVIEASSNENSLIADFFCGSGTTLAVAEKLGRRWIGCDLGRYAIHSTRKRMMEISDCKPFEILNLGRYERQIWQGITFDVQKQAQQMLIFEYLKFILELYGAQPLAGTQVLHGKKGAAVVHVGAVDAPVTIDEVIACLNECKQMGQKELHILGWEWEMGLANLMVDEAKSQGIKLLMLTIPREVMEQQAVDKGDIRFFELAYLECVIQVKDGQVTVSLTDFVIPNTDLIPQDVREKIKKWSDYVDYWAIDWDFQNDAFVNGWTSYRTRKERALLLKSEAHTYPVKGTYRIVVKVIDIFGNDTSQVFEVTI